MAEARKLDTGMDMFPDYERPTRSNVTDPTTKIATHLVLATRDPAQLSHLAPHVGRQM